MKQDDAWLYRFGPILAGAAGGVLAMALLLPFSADRAPGAIGIVLTGLGGLAVVGLTVLAGLGLRRASRYRDLARSLERRLADVEIFALAARHDLREPLRKIITFGERLREQLGPAPDAQLDRYAERMSDAAERMQVMLDELAVYSRINDASTRLEAFAAGEEIDEVVDGAAARLSACGGTVSLAGDLPMVRADRTQFRTLFGILLDNAIQYAHAERALVVTISAGAGADGQAMIHVQDNGIGFDPDKAERIFRPLERLHARDAYPGTGIGLATARKIAERQGGQLIARGESGIGAHFTLILPRQKASLYQERSKPTIQPG